MQQQDRRWKERSVTPILQQIGQPTSALDLHNDDPVFSLYSKIAILKSLLSRQSKSGVETIVVSGAGAVRLDFKLFQYLPKWH